MQIHRNLHIVNLISKRSFLYHTLIKGSKKEIIYYTKTFYWIICLIVQFTVLHKNLQCFEPSYEDEKWINCVKSLHVQTFHLLKMQITYLYKKALSGNKWKKSDFSILHSTKFVVFFLSNFCIKTLTWKISFPNFIMILNIYLNKWIWMYYMSIYL